MIAKHIPVCSMQLKTVNKIVPKVRMCSAGVCGVEGDLKIIGPLDRGCCKIVQCIDRGV